MIIDSFIFGWETDLLECRLTELYDHVDVFLVIEGRYTFQNSEKELVFEKHRDRYAKWADKIMYYVVDNFDGLPDNPWEREYHSRKVTADATAQFPDDAILLMSDVDEIPHPDGIVEAVSLLGQGHKTVSFFHPFYSMAVDWMHPDKIHGLVATTLGYARSRTSFMDIRGSRMLPPTISDYKAGWHFTWLGGEELITRKAASFSHTEDFVQNYIKEMGPRLYTEGYHVLGEKLIPVEVDSTFPKYITEGNCPAVWFRPVSPQG
jgi:beta-1,4-mannosyl-glycoprotein beta-1,4-N-acetylglucosaminyltransferase